MNEKGILMWPIIYILVGLMLLPWVLIAALLLVGWLMDAGAPPTNWRGL